MLGYAVLEECEAGRSVPLIDVADMDLDEGAGKAVHRVPQGIAVTIQIELQPSIPRSCRQNGSPVMRPRSRIASACASVKAPACDARSSSHDAAQSTSIVDQPVLDRNGNESVGLNLFIGAKTHSIASPSKLV